MTKLHEIDATIKKIDHFSHNRDAGNAATEAFRLIAEIRRMVDHPNGFHEEVYGGISLQSVFSQKSRENRSRQRRFDQ